MSWFRDCFVAICRLPYTTVNKKRKKVDGEFCDLTSLVALSDFRLSSLLALLRAHLCIQAHDRLSSDDARPWRPCCRAPGPCLAIPHAGARERRKPTACTTILIEPPDLLTNRDRTFFRTFFNYLQVDQNLGGYCTIQTIYSTTQEPVCSEPCKNGEWIPS
jgi:hypothetical protein